MNSGSENDKGNTLENASGSRTLSRDPPPRGNGREEEERKPTLRSVAIAQPPSMALGMPPSLAMPKPMFQRTPKLSPVQGNVTKKYPDLKQAGKRWDLKLAPELPWYPLEKTFDIDQPSSVVAQRIDSCLQQRSVFAQFENAVATCMTGCYTKFKISLFNAGDGNNKTTVEVQLRKGCPMAFRKERAAIINAANGVETKEVKPRSFPIPDCVAAKFKPQREDELRRMLAKIVKELESGMRDDMLMTLRSLSCMTNIEKSTPDSCKKIAKILVESDVGIRDILSRILSGRSRDQGDAMLRNATHNIIINVLNVLAKERILAQVINCDKAWFTDTLLPSLVDEIRNCDCIHNACLSSKCVSILIQNSPIISSHVLGGRSDVVGVLQEAVARGGALHQKLHDEAQGAINALQCQ